MVSFQNLILAFSATAYITAASQLQWTDCGSDPGLVISSLSITPMPMEIPGSISLSVSARTSVPIPEDMTISLIIKRHTFLLDVPLPCFLHIGSCTYENTCSKPLVDTLISENWAGITADIGQQIKTMLSTLPALNTTCPPPVPASIAVNNYSIRLPAIPAILTFIVDGDYSVVATARDKATGHTLMCVFFEMSIK
ncbi:ganglioside GM2 activator-like [Pomacea canaliculata]|uniref:ganglioside GM2 activator-like n=1 Tax=Pomacea canaliculata TaxID=400727 RepID=UPI000D73BA5C|nr:ganglioside GM2 activator-like [Pomacea canaliculata]